MTIGRLRAGLAILEKYTGPGNDDVATEHDIIYAGPDGIEGISEEDLAELGRLGWFVDTETGSWAAFM